MNEVAPDAVAFCGSQACGCDHGRALETAYVDADFSERRNVLLADGAGHTFIHTVRVCFDQAALIEQGSYEPSYEGRVVGC